MSEAVPPGDGPHGPADLIEVSVGNRNHAAARTAEGRTERTGLLGGGDHVIEVGVGARPARLMQPIVHRVGQQGTIALERRQHPLGDPAEVEDRILARGTARHPPARWPIAAMHPRAAVVDGGDAEAAVQGRGQVVAMPFQREGELEDPLPGHAQPAQFRAKDDPGDDGGGAAPQATADRHLVADGKFEPLERAAPSIEGLLGRAGEQVATGERHLARALALPDDRRLFGLARGDVEVQVERQGEDVETRSEVGRRRRHPDRGGSRHYSLNASCNAATASLTRSTSMMQVMRISEVEIISMLMPRSDRVRNMEAATPACPRMPLPTTDTLASPFWASTVRAPMSAATPSRMRFACRASVIETVNDMSVIPSWLAVCTMTSAAMSASASGAKMAAAIPGRSGTPTTERRATCSSCAIPRTRFRSSMIASSEQMMVPGPAWKLERTWSSIENASAISIARGCITRAPALASSSISG